MKAPRATTMDAIRLFREGSIALAKVEANGIRIDTGYLDKAIRKTSKRYKELKASLQDSKVVKVWRKTFRQRTNLDSNDQLGKVLFGVLGHECPTTTATGKYATDEATLATVDDPFVRDWLQVKKLHKILTTYLGGIRREVDHEGILHPVFNLHLVKTYRSSSDSPNFQNIPVRNEESKELIRTAFVPRPGRRFVEIDYKGIEVNVAACYHKDPRMLEYLLDPSKDMHRDMAMECYRLPQEEVSKKIRYAGKNMFVFPQFYGSYWLDCSAALWSALEGLKLETTSGVPLKRWLAQKGLKRLGAQRRDGDPEPGTFEAHIRDVERRFWTQRFPVYHRWRKEWMAKYEERGWFRSLTGFTYSGVFRRNEVINWAVQGAAFHCLLKSLILLQAAIEKRGWKTLIVGQIHDCVLLDSPEEEYQDVLRLAGKIMAKRLQKLWPWIIVPMSIEAETSELDGSWARMTHVEIPR